VPDRVLLVDLAMTAKQVGCTCATVPLLFHDARVCLKTNLVTLFPCHANECQNVIRANVYNNTMNCYQPYIVKFVYQNDRW
jgi:hypothetical protein